MINTSWDRRTFLVQTAAVVARAARSAVPGDSPSSGKQNGSSVSGSLTIAQWTNPPEVKITQEPNRAFKVILRTALNPNNGYGALTSSLLAWKSVDIIAQFPLTPAAFPSDHTRQKSSNFAALVAAGKVVNLTAQQFLEHDDTAGQTYAYGSEDRIHGLTAAEYVATGGLFSKEAVREKHGVNVPTTREQFVAALERLKSTGMSPIFVLWAAEPCGSSNERNSHRD